LAQERGASEASTMTVRAIVAADFTVASLCARFEYDVRSRSKMTDADSIGLDDVQGYAGACLGGPPCA